jgi:hypothetical protein
MKTNYDLFIEFIDEVKLVAELFKEDLNKGKVAPEHIMQAATFKYKNKLNEQAKELLKAKDIFNL